MKISEKAKEIGKWTEKKKKTGGKKNERIEKTMTYRGNETQSLNRFSNSWLFDDTCLRSMAELAIYPIPMSICRPLFQAVQVLYAKIHSFLITSNK